MVRRPMWKPKPQVHKLRAPVERHLGINLADAQSVAHEIKPVERVNLQRVLDRWAAASEPPVEAVGYSTTGYFADHALAKYLLTDELIRAPVERVQLESGPGESLDCVERGLFLFRRDGVPVVIAFCPPRFSRDEHVVEVIAGTREAARATLSALLSEAQRDSVYKGRMLSLQPPENWGGQMSIRFYDVRPTARRSSRNCCRRRP